MLQRNNDLTENVNNSDELLFDVATPIGITVHTTRQYWAYITNSKHPSLQDKIELVVQTLQQPDQIRQSRSDPNVLLFYHRIGSIRWVCAVVKDQGETGFLISAYPTDKIKRGKMIWKK